MIMLIQINRPWPPLVGAKLLWWAWLANGHLPPASWLQKLVVQHLESCKGNGGHLDGASAGEIWRLGTHHLGDFSPRQGSSLGLVYDCPAKIPPAQFPYKSILGVFFHNRWEETSGNTHSLCSISITIAFILQTVIHQRSDKCTRHATMISGCMNTFMWPFFKHSFPCSTFYLFFISIVVVRKGNVPRADLASRQVNHWSVPVFVVVALQWPGQRCMWHAPP